MSTRPCKWVSMPHRSAWLKLLAMGLVSVLMVTAPTAASAVQAQATRSSVDAGPADSWSPVDPMLWLAKVNSGGSADLSSVSCAGADTCAALGQVSPPNKIPIGVLVSEVHGTWQRAIVTTINSPQGPTSISCGAVGNCLAADGEDAAIEVGGKWESPIPFPGLHALEESSGGSAQVSSVSCASASNCSVVGWYLDHHNGIWGPSRDFELNEVAGSWSSASVLPGLDSLGGVDGFSYFDSPAISCSSPGDCSAGGCISESSGFEGEPTDCLPFIADEVEGTWTSAFELSGFSNLGISGAVTSLSCASTSDCSAAGNFVDPGGRHGTFVADETGGIWSPTLAVRGISRSKLGTMPSPTLSCSNAGNCSLVGYYGGANPKGLNAFIANEVGGVWGAASGSPAGNGISCASAGYCVAFGFRDLVDEVAGALEPAQVLRVDTGRFVFNPESVSCNASGFCGVGGSYNNKSGVEAAVVSGRLPLST
jgi:hypothetical protein